MASNNNTFEPFAIKDCALIAIATGKKAQNLNALKEIVRKLEKGFSNTLSQYKKCAYCGKYFKSDKPNTAVEFCSTDCERLFKATI